MSAGARCSVALLLLPVLVAHLGAQVIRGRAIDSLSRAGVSGALVELRDSGGTSVVQAFTGADGGFAFRVSADQRYQLRFAAIGYARHPLVNVTASDASITTADVVLTPVAVSLPQLHALAGKRACGRSELNAETFGGLLEGARTSLQLMDATLKSHALEFETRTVHRVTMVRQGADSTVRADTTAALLHEWPVRSLPVDSLELVGFQRVATAAEGGGHIWYGPDLATLFSDWFLDTHCFTLDKSRTHGDTVSIRFDPEGHPRHVDLSGELVIDRATLTLRQLSYAHRHIPDGVPDRSAGGEMHFSELAPGLWVPSEWSIWAPITRTVRMIGRPTLLIVGRGGARPTSISAAPLNPAPSVMVIGRDEVRGAVLRVIPTGT